MEESTPEGGESKTKPSASDELYLSLEQASADSMIQHYVKTECEQTGKSPEDLARAYAEAGYSGQTASFLNASNLSLPEKKGIMALACEKQAGREEQWAASANNVQNNTMWRTMAAMSREKASMLRT